MSETDMQAPVELKLTIPTICHTMLEELAKTGLYDQQVACPRLAEDEADAHTEECPDCEGAEVVFKRGPGAVSSELIRRVLYDLVGDGGFARLSGKTLRDMKKASP